MRIAFASNEDHAAAAASRDDLLLRRRAVDLGRRTAVLRPGTVLGREWNGQMQRVAVLADGFAWNGKTYPSLSKVAFAITGTRWNGPKFFGLRGKPAKGDNPRNRNDSEGSVTSKA